MLDLSDLVPFHSGQTRNFYLLVLGQLQIKFTILYFVIGDYHEHTCCVETIVDPDQLASGEAS